MVEEKNEEEDKSSSSNGSQGAASKLTKEEVEQIQAEILETQTKLYQLQARYNNQLGEQASHIPDNGTVN